MKSKGSRGSLILLLLVVFGVPLLTLLPQVVSSGEDDAKALLTKSVEAVGGMDAATGWKTRVSKGHLMTNWPGWGDLNADCIDLVEKPDKMKLDQDFSAYDHPFFFAYYYNGGDAWMMINLGVRENERTTQRMTERMRTVDGVAYYLANSEAFYMVADVEDDSLVTAASIDRIGVVDEGDTVLIDLDKKTHLPVRHLYNGGARQVLYDDYRDAGGIKMPFHVTSFDQGAKSEYRWKEIKFNEKIDPAVFEEYRPKKKEEGS
ncbi:MAG: hypothetical protein JSW50_05545 [Candidatus Latescibacterota bacterium]|nr:MAG: hypothetical protein JSW50_05545 [Candidatus Latescibacterota bacterium]